MPSLIVKKKDKNKSAEHDQLVKPIAQVGLSDNLDSNNIDDVRELFYALSDKIRLKIIKLLTENEEICVCKFQEIFKLPQPNLSFHLSILRKAKLVNTRKKGTWTFYKLNRENFIINILFSTIKDMRDDDKNNPNENENCLKNLLCDAE